MAVYRGSRRGGRHSEGVLGALLAPLLVSSQFRSYCCIVRGDGTQLFRCLHWTLDVQQYSVLAQAVAQ